MTTTSTAPHRVPPSPALRDGGVVAVLRARHAREYAPVVAALLRGGVRCVELTLSTDGVVAELPALRAEFGDEADLGVGTVVSAAQCEEVVEAGAAYVVTPVTDTGVVRTAVARGVPVYPGGLTPTELFAGWSAGATAVKVFPASVVGPSYVAHLRGPFPGVQVVPSGGIGLDDVAGWVRAGALAVSLGGPLVQDAFAGGDLGALTARARRVVETVRAAREGGR